jgi:hypothetical protein
VLIRAVAIAELHVVPDQYPDTFPLALHNLCAVYLVLKEYGQAQPIAERQLALQEQFLARGSRRTGSVRSMSEVRPFFSPRTSVRSPAFHGAGLAGHLS